MLGFNNSVQENTYSIGNAIVSLGSSQNDEMVVLNKSPLMYVRTRDILEGR